jgi:hypothetical protein
MHLPSSHVETSISDRNSDALSQELVCHWYLGDIRIYSEVQE